jgi:hypothetical protein
MSKVGIQTIEKSRFDSVWTINCPNIKNAVITWLLKLEKDEIFVRVVPPLL